MMAPSNPYGPSAPPPPGLASQLPIMSSMRPNPMYRSGGGMGGSGSSMGGGGGGMGPGGPMPPGPPLHSSSMHPSQGGSVGGSQSPPTSRVLTSTQLQQLSAQMRAYRFISRHMAPPEALMCIVQGRRPTPAMLAALTNKPQASPFGPTSAGGPGGGGGAGGGAPGRSPNASPGPGGATSGGGGGGGNISLYPPSPSKGITQGAPPGPPSQLTPASTSSLTRSTSATSLSSAPGSSSSSSAPTTVPSTAAPNITISSSGELPLPVRQALAAAPQNSSSSGPPGQPSSLLAAAKLPPGLGQGSNTIPGSATPPATTKPQQQQQPQPQQQQQQQQQQHSQQKPQQHQQAVKPVKLAPTGKPQGVDPMIIMKEREHRYVCVAD